jgi:hypothetical protein
MATKSIAGKRACCPGIMQLDAFLRFRGTLEGVSYGLTPSYLQAAYDCGTRWFFGVRVDRGAILDDEENSEAFAQWRGRH